MFTWNLVLSLASAQGERKPTPCTGTKVSHEAVDIPALTYLEDWIDFRSSETINNIKTIFIVDCRGLKLSILTVTVCCTLRS